MALTIEEITLWVAEAVSPLQDRLSAGSVEQFFSEIGLPAPDVVSQVPAVMTATTEVVAKVAALIPHIPELTSAIADKDLGEIKRIVEVATPIVKELSTAVQALADTIESIAGSVNANTAQLQAFAAELPERLFGNLLSVHLERESPTVYDLALLLGLVEVTHVGSNGDIPAHSRRVVRFDRFGQLIDDPFNLIGDVYGWGTADFEWSLFIRHLFNVMGATGFGFVERPVENGVPALRIVLVDIAPTDDPVPGLRATTRAEIADNAEFSSQLTDTLSWQVKSSGAMEAGTGIEILPPADVQVIPLNLDVQGDVSIGLKIEDSEGERVILIGSAAGIRIEARSISVGAGAGLVWQIADGKATGDFLAEAAIKDARFVLDFEDADGFLATLLPDDGVALTFELSLKWSELGGLEIDGGAGLEVDLPVDFELGPVRFSSIHLELAVGAGGIATVLGTSISAKLGPFGLVIDKVGATMALSFPDGGGNLGPANLGVAFKPPEGIGLSLDVSVVKGGGYLGINEEGTEYSGVLELSLGPVSIKAIGILTTELPEDDGWALLLLVFTEFNAVQLGFGFTLNGVGGIIGLQHGISPDALQSGLRTGVLNSVLFPKDPVTNAPRLLGQLRVVFPITPGALTVGPVLKIGWSTPPIVTLSLGIVLQFDDVLHSSSSSPQLTRIVLLGQLKVQLPPDLSTDTQELVKLLIDIVGSYEVREKTLAIDAVLTRDSHVAGLPITGSMIVRARFGEDPSFILAVGGFHPRFTDLPPGIPQQERMGLQLQYDIVTVRLVGYTAITSNSFQIGAEASVTAIGGSFRVEGFVSFDALFLFQPVFHFEIDFRVGMAIKWKSHSLASVKVSGVLSGPGYWVVAGHASFSILFWDVGIDFEVDWGDAPATPLTTVAVADRLVEALEDQSNWTAQIPFGSEALVTFRQPATDDVLAHPRGQLSVMQRVVPLGIDIDRIGTATPSDGNTFDISGVRIGTSGDFVSPNYDQEHFARGEFLDLSEEEKLSTPSFEHFRAGVALSSEDYETSGFSDQVAFDPDFEEFYLGQPEVPPTLGTFPKVFAVQLARFGAASYSPLRAKDKLVGDSSLVMKATQPLFVVADAAALTPVGEPVDGLSVAAVASAAATGKTLVVELAEVVGVS